MKTALIRLLLAWLGFILCNIASLLFWARVVPWPVPGPRGWLFAATMVTPLFVLGIVARSRFRWPIRDFLTSYGVVVLTILLFFSSGTDLDAPVTMAYILQHLFDSENLEMTGSCSLAIGVAWFTGFVVGTIYLVVRKRRMASKITTG